PPRLLASFGVAQGIYGLLKPAVPGTPQIDVNGLIKQVEISAASVKAITTTTPVQSTPTTGKQAASEVKANTATA
ncbi:hypothetical protein, partial [Bifidobacterium tsurumiense]